MDSKREELMKPVREISRQAFSALRKGRSHFTLEMSDISHDSEYVQLFTDPDSPEGFVLRREPSGDAWVLFDAEEVLLCIGKGLGMNVKRVQAIFAAKRAELERCRDE